METARFTKVLEACEIAAFSPAKRTLYNRSVMKEQDVINQLYYAKEEGLAEGREEGLAEGEAKKSLEIAKKMLEMGLSRRTDHGGYRSFGRRSS